MMKRNYVLPFILFLSFLPVIVPFQIRAHEVRTWTTTKGSELEARFDRLQGSYVILRRENGVQVTVEFAVLSDADQHYVRQTSSELNKGGVWSIGYSDVTFFNQKARTKAVGILVDISASMSAKGAISKAQNEVASMLTNINEETRFTLISFIQGADAMSDQMLESTQVNKDQAMVWMGALKTNNKLNKKGIIGSSPLDAIKLAADQGVDTMFLLTDDEPNLHVIDEKRKRTPLKSHPEDIVRFVNEMNTTYGRQIIINPIIYKASNNRGKESRRYWNRIAKATGGELMVYDDE